MGKQYKVCTNCKANKTKDEFCKRAASKDGLNARCKVCKSKIDKEYRQQNVEKKRERDKKYRKHNAEKVKIRKKKYYQENKEAILTKCREYYVDNKEYIKERVGRYRVNNRDKINAYFNKRMKEDLNFRLAKQLRIRLNGALKNKQKVGSAIDNLGCSVDELIVHLENQFCEGMLWSNYGVHGWHIDHIKPLSKFNLSDPRELRKACHYTNLQPLWAEDNIRKGAR